MGIKALRKIQIGREGIKGQATAATAALVGALTMVERPTVYRPDDERATLAQYSRSIKVANLAELTLEGDLTFQQVLYALHMGVLGGVTPVAAGTNGKEWVFTPSITASGAYDSFTIEYGDDVQAWEVEYCLARQIEISGGMGEPVKIRANLFGRKMSQCTFTSGLIPPAVEPAIATKARLYINDEDEAMGATEKSATLISWVFTINTGLIPVRYADGMLDFSAYSEQYKGVELRMTFAFNSGAEAEHLKADGETLRLVRIRVDGSTIAPDSQHRLDLDVCGIWLPDRWSTLGERDGEDIVDVVLSAQRGMNYTKLFEVVVINAVGALP